MPSYVDFCHDAYIPLDKAVLQCENVNYRHREPGSSAYLYSTVYVMDVYLTSCIDVLRSFNYYTAQQYNPPAEVRSTFQSTSTAAVLLCTLYIVLSHHLKKKKNYCLTPAGAPN